MARVSGVDLPNDKRMEIALTYVYGIGLRTSQQALAAAGIDPNTKARDVTDDELIRLREYIDKNLIVVADRAQR